MKPEVLAKRLARAQAEIRGLERLIETKARDLYLSQESLRRSVEFQEKVLSSMASALVVLDAEGRITQANQAAVSTLGYPNETALLGVAFATLTTQPEQPTGWLKCDPRDLELVAQDGRLVPVHFTRSPMRASDGSIEAYVCVWLDLSDQRQLEIELRHAQKLESLGQMAAGVAHEINTPIQFVGDSLSFLQEAFDDLRRVLTTYRQSREQWGRDARFAQWVQAVTAAEEEADIEFVEAEAPGAFERASHGLSRVASIVKALKSFSHPGSEDVAPTDLNEVIATTLTLAHNEYKYVADLETDLKELPEVPCHAGDMGQVFLNLIVNAAHAIEEKAQGTGEHGRIRIASRQEGDWAVYSISDTGAGIPAHVMDRIFDPFFTTKEVGKGTGQGLAISQRIVVEKHRGRIEVDSSPGEGTTFRIFLPLRRAGLAA